MGRSRPAAAEELYCANIIHERSSEVQPISFRNDPQWNRYWKNILYKLTGDDISAFLGVKVAPDLAIVSAPGPAAYAVRPDRLVISSGLLNLVDTPSELAFVLAHELAHVVLHHVDGDKAHQKSANDLIEQELMADALALKMLREGGFVTSAGLSMLTKLRTFGNEKGIQLESAYPSLSIRFQELNRVLGNSEHGLG